MRGSVSDFEPVANKLVFRNLLRSWDGAPKGAAIRVMRPVSEQLPSILAESFDAAKDRGVLNDEKA